MSGTESMLHVSREDPNGVQPMHPWVLVLSAALGGFLFGYDTAIVNGGLFEMKKSFDISDESWIAGFIVSSAIIGAVFGALGGGVLANTHGRRLALCAGDVAFIVGAAVIAAAPDIPVVIVGRVILGVGIGIASIVVPIYIAEITSPERRGPAVVANNFCITGAQFLAALVAVAFVFAESESTKNPWGWRAMFALAALPAALQLLLLSRMPESPSWLAMRGRPQADVRAAARRAGIALPGCAGDSSQDPNTRVNESSDLLSAPEVATQARHTHQPSEFDAAATVAVDASGNLVVPDKPATILDLVGAPELRPRIFLGVALQLLQQLCGINTVMYYSATILKHSGYSGSRDPVVFSVPLAGTNALFTLLGFRIVEKYGRRPLILASLVGCALFLVIFATIAFIYDNDHPPKGAAVGFIISLIGYLACFAPGMGSGPWVVNAEIYPLRYRSAANSIATTANWVSNAAVSQSFPVLMGWAGTGATFSVLVGMCVVGIFYVWFWLPETKGLSLEHLEKGLPPVRRTCFDRGDPDDVARIEAA